MPVLAYCIAEAGPEIEVPRAGVHGTGIQVLDGSGLRCFVSRHDEPDAGCRPVRETALVFHRVLQDIFRQAAIIPFRFPTILADDSEIAEFLRKHAAEYQAALTRLRDKVQMEIHVSSRRPPHSTPPAAQSGKSYLKQQQALHRKLSDALRELRHAGNSWIEDWDEREVWNGIRGYALVGRASIQAFLDHVGGVRVPAEVTARVSGPWPATEFLAKAQAQE